MILGVVSRRIFFDNDSIKMGIPFLYLSDDWPIYLEDIPEN
jgi:hypothetical protein